MTGMSSDSILSSPKRMSISVPKNVNVFWVTATVLAIWFLFGHTPTWIQSRLPMLCDWVFVAHLVGVIGVYLACVVNTLVTPSWNRELHVWVGRVGLVLGYLSFPFGVYMTWWRPGVEFNFDAFITIGGVVQMLIQIRGYKAIKKY